MNNVIELSEYKNFSIKKDHNQNENLDLTSEQIKKLENLRDDIEKLLNTATAVHGEPLGVGLAAGRYAAMKLAQLTGEKSTKQFINDCIKTTLKHKVFH